MKSNESVSGERRTATLKDIAEQAGVSRATVSLVLRQSPLVATETRARVEAAISSVGYVYNRGAARLRTGTSGTVGLVVPEITNPFFAELTAGIDQVLEAEGRLTFLANSNERPERQARFIQRIREEGADGIILCAAEGTSPSLLTQLRQWHLPCVQILRLIDGEDGDAVRPDFRKGIMMALRHLASAGHVRIALLPSSKNTSAARERIEAFVASGPSQALDLGPIVPCSSSPADAADAIGRVLASADRPTAVICHNDLIALGVVRELKRRGLKPGRDMSVIGFDDIPEAANAVPALSTVATRPTEVGIQAAKLFLRRLAAPDTPHEQVLVAPRLVLRET